MSLDLKKLEKVVDLADGGKRARCPACAELCQDKKGEHLRIYPNGKFGCCVYQGDQAHRKRIYALAGGRSQQGIKVRVTTAGAGKPTQCDILGRLERLFPNPTTDATDGVNELEQRKIEPRTLRTVETKSNSENDDTENPRTLRTPNFNSKLNLVSEGFLPLTDNTIPRTLRTPLLNPYAYTKKESNVQSTYKEFRLGVRSVREQERCEDARKSSERQEGSFDTPKNCDKGRMPFFTAGGVLSIPFDSPERFHWWKGGQDIDETIAEVRSWTIAKEQHETGI
jgi:hypothetical protein